MRIRTPSESADDLNVLRIFWVLHEAQYRVLHQYLNSFPALLLQQGRKMRKSKTYKNLDNSFQEMEMENINTTHRQMHDKSYSRKKQLLNDINHRPMSQSPRHQDNSVVLSNSKSQSPKTRKKFKFDAIKHSFIDEIDPNYSIINLTYTFLIEDWNIYFLVTWIIVMTLIRYYTMVCLLYVVIKVPSSWEWIFVVVGSRLIYFILVLKVSIKVPQNRTQMLLKKYWDSNQNQLSELFVQVSFSKLYISFIRALIPAEFSFVYLKGTNFKKRFQVYFAINYIFCGIETILYYPFFIIYCAVIDQLGNSTLNVITPVVTLFLASIGEVVCMSLTLYLMWLGCMKKYPLFKKQTQQNLKITQRNLMMYKQSQ